MHTEQEKIDAMGVLALFTNSVQCLHETSKNNNTLTDVEVLMVNNFVSEMIPTLRRLEAIVRGEDK